MNPWIGWALAIAALGIGWQTQGWQGVLLAFSVIVFWLVLQFNKAVRVMRQAASAPVGYIDSAVMLNARLQRGMPMLRIVMLTRSLGQKISQDGAAGPEQFRWSDPGGSHVTLDLKGGRLMSWTLWRPAEAEEVVPAATDAVPDGTSGEGAARSGPAS